MQQKLPNGLNGIGELVKENEIKTDFLKKDEFQKGSI